MEAYDADPSTAKFGPRVAYFGQSYRPKNNHSRIITGIGTPSSQSKIPRPIGSSSLINESTQGRRTRSTPAFFS